MNRLFQMAVVTLVVTLPATCGAAKLREEWGVGFNDATVDDGAKFASLSIPGKLPVFDYAWELGGWADRADGRRAAAFLDVMAGVEPETDRLYARYLCGPAVISGTDSMLGSNLQVAHELAFGVKDARGVRLGVEYRHFSNAGIVKPNQGRDFIGFQAEFPIGGAK